MSRDESRRAFLKVAGAAIAVAACSRRGGAGATQMQSATPGPAPGIADPLPDASPNAPAPVATSGPVPSGPIGGGPPPDAFQVPSGVAMPMRKLGITGVEISCIGLGGWHIGVPPEPEALRIVHETLDHGLTFIDSCWDYHHGDSDRRIGKALSTSGYREKAFLQTKLDGRIASAFTEQLDQSLRWLRTDHVDLLLLHEVIHPSDPERFFGPGGAAEAMTRAREQGKTRFVGFSGHKSPQLMLAMLDAARKHSFRFDAVQMPLNAMDAQRGQDSFQQIVLPVLLRDDLGVLGMKPMGSGILLESGLLTGVECLRYAMSLPVSVTITGMDSVGVMNQDLHVALAFEPMSESEKQALFAKTAKAARSGDYTQYETTTRFDSTTQNPRWLTTAEMYPPGAGPAGPSGGPAHP